MGRVVSVSQTVGWRRQSAALIALLMLAIALVVVVVALLQNLAALSLGLPGVAFLTLGAWWAITEVGVRRILAVLAGGIGLVLLVIALVMALDHPEDVVVRFVVVLALLALAIALARYSLIGSGPKPPPATARQPLRPVKPVLLCNPWSGGGKVEKFDLIDLATELGVETVLLAEGLDLEELTRDAVARGADCLGMAGGDGSQALVASVAAEHDLPYVCIPAGTRNHFALDLGLDRTDPRTAMYAFRDAEERHVDFATVNDRLFVNNVSLGVYATIVQSDEYRDAKVDITRSMLHELLGRQAEPFDLQYATPDGKQIDGAFLIMVSNNPYVLGARRDVSQRREMDSGRLGVFAVSTKTGHDAARLMTLSALGLRNLSPHWYEFTADEFEVHSKSGSAFMGVDGEALESSTPMRFRIHPGGLRMFMPTGNLQTAERRRARNLRVGDIASVAVGREPRSV